MCIKVFTSKNYKFGFLMSWKNTKHLTVHWNTTQVVIIWFLYNSPILSISKNMLLTIDKYLCDSARRNGDFEAISFFFSNKQVKPGSKKQRKQRISFITLDCVDQYQWIRCHFEAQKTFHATNIWHKLSCYWVEHYFKTSYERIL